MVPVVTPSPHTLTPCRVHTGEAPPDRDPFMGLPCFSRLYAPPPPFRILQLPTQTSRQVARSDLSVPLYLFDENPCGTSPPSPCCSPARPLSTASSQLCALARRASGAQGQPSLVWPSRMATTTFARAGRSQAFALLRGLAARCGRGRRWPCPLRAQRRVAYACEDAPEAAAARGRLLGCGAARRRKARAISYV